MHFRVTLCLLLFVNLVEDAAVREVLALSLVPTAEVADVNQVHVLVKFLVLVKDSFVGGTVVVLCGNVLAFIRIEVAQVFGCEFAGATLVNNFIYNSDRGFCQDAHARDDDFVIVGVVLEREECFVFPSEQNVALAVFDKRCRGAASA